MQEITKQDEDPQTGNTWGAHRKHATTSPQEGFKKLSRQDEDSQSRTGGVREIRLNKNAVSQQETSVKQM